MSKLNNLIIKVPEKYERLPWSEIVRAICMQVDQLSECRQVANYQAQASVPTGTAVAYAVGDFVPDSNATVRGSVAPGVASSYVRIGWKCTASGSPGTFVECRVLTGT